MMQTKELTSMADLFFIFGGFHLAFSAYMLVGIPSTGSAGLINLIGCFATGSIVAGVFCALATAGWTMQMLGLLWEYRAVSPSRSSHRGSPTVCSQIWAQ
jgi:hypothetical protein